MGSEVEVDNKQSPLDALVASFEGKAIHVAKLRAAALLWLDIRQTVLCDLSANSSRLSASGNEWPSGRGHEDALAQTRFLRDLMAFLAHEAEQLSGGDAEQLVWAALDEQAKKWGFPPEADWNNRDDNGGVGEGIGDCER